MILTKFTIPLLVIVAIPQLSAIKINVNGTDYELTTIQTYYDQAIPLLESQPWFGDVGFAAEAAGQFRQVDRPSVLLNGVSWDPDRGPLFAWRRGFIPFHFEWVQGGTQTVFSGDDFTDTSHIFAIVNRTVPDNGVAAVMLGYTMLVLIAIRRRMGRN